MLMALPPLSLLNLLARDERGAAVRRPARLLGARWLSMRNGIAGWECHIDGPIVLSLFRVLAHDQVPFARPHLDVIKTLSAGSGSVTRFGPVPSQPRFPSADQERSESGSMARSPHTGAGAQEACAASPRASAADAHAGI